MLKLSSGRGIKIDVPVLSVSWSSVDHSVIIQALLEQGLIEREASDTGGVPRRKSSCPDCLAEATARSRPSAQFAQTVKYENHAKPSSPWRYSNMIPYYTGKLSEHHGEISGLNSTGKDNFNDIRHHLKASTPSSTPTSASTPPATPTSASTKGSAPASA